MLREALEDVICACEIDEMTHDEGPCKKIKALAKTKPEVGK